MNLEPDARKSITNNSSLMSSSKKGIVGGNTVRTGDIYTSNGYTQSQAYTHSKQQTAEPISPANNIKHHGTENAYSSTSEPKILKAPIVYEGSTSPRVITAQSNNGSVRTYGRVAGTTESYQSPSKVVRKTGLVEP